MSLDVRHPGACRSVHDAAWFANSGGLSICPPAEDGTKRPDATWGLLQQQRPTHEQVSEWYPAAGTRTGRGVICGKVSGNLEVLEFDDRDVRDSTAKKQPRVPGRAPRGQGSRVGLAARVIRRY